MSLSWSDGLDTGLSPQRPGFNSVCRRSHFGFFFLDISFQSVWRRITGPLDKTVKVSINQNTPKVMWLNGFKYDICKTYSNTYTLDIRFYYICTLCLYYYFLVLKYFRYVPMKCMLRLF